MKQVFSIILVFSILSFQFSELLIYAAFKINQDYIAKNLCVEKDVKNSACKGCCQLKKKVKEQEEQKEDLPPSQTEKQNINFCNHTSEINLSNLSETQVWSIHNEIIYGFSLINAVFHPPEGTF